MIPRSTKRLLVLMSPIITTALGISIMLLMPGGPFLLVYGGMLLLLVIFFNMLFVIFYFINHRKLKD